MQQQNDLRINGEVHHYQLDQGLYSLLRFFPQDADIQALRESVGKMPSKGQTYQLALQAKDVLKKRSKDLSHVDLANIYYVIDHARQLTADPEQDPGALHTSMQ